MMQILILFKVRNSKWKNDELFILNFLMKYKIIFFVVLLNGLGVGGYINWIHCDELLLILVAFWFCFKSVEQKGCKSEQSDGIIWNTTLAGTTKKEPCPENQIGLIKLSKLKNINLMNKLMKTHSQYFKRYILICFRLCNKVL